MQEFYSLIGEFSIAEDKKEEFNSLVLKLLYKCGIRKLKKIKLGEKEISVISKLEPDEQGIVSFDYSIYEKEKRNISTYNMNTCELTIDECGFNEFGVALMLVQTMKESYSATRCYLALGGEIEKVNIRALLIENILGIRLRFPYRADLWGMYVFCKEHFKDRDIDLVKVIDWLPNQYEETNIQHLLDIGYISNFIEQKFNIVEFTKEQIADLEKDEQNDLLYSTYCKLLSDKKIKLYIKELIQKSFEERKIMAEENGEYGIIAELSLYLTPATLVRIFGNVLKVEFWELWKEVSENGFYLDNINKGYDKDAKKESNFSVPFYEIILRENEDEFLGIWNDRKLQLSDKMLNSINMWKEKYQTIEIPNDFETKREMKKLVNNLSDEWDITHVEENFITEFIHNKNDMRYKKALFLLRDVMDKSVEYFPELTRKQAIKWIIKYAREEFETIEIVVLIQVFGNNETRKNIFGF